MSVFAQVWLWALVAFLIGVLLTWILLVRPAHQRVRQLERHLREERERDRSQGQSSPAATGGRDERDDPAEAASAAEWPQREPGQQHPPPPGVEQGTRHGRTSWMESDSFSAAPPRRVEPGQPHREQHARFTEPVTPPPPPQQPGTPAPGTQAHGERPEAEQTRFIRPAGYADHGAATPAQAGEGRQPADVTGYQGTAPQGTDHISVDEHQQGAGERADAERFPAGEQVYEGGGATYPAGAPWQQQEDTAYAGGETVQQPQEATGTELFSPEEPRSDYLGTTFEPQGEPERRFSAPEQDAERWSTAAGQQSSSHADAHAEQPWGSHADAGVEQPWPSAMEQGAEQWSFQADAGVEQQLSSHADAGVEQQLSSHADAGVEQSWASYADAGAEQAFERSAQDVAGYGAGERPGEATGSRADVDAATGAEEATALSDPFSEPLETDATPDGPPLPKRTRGANHSIRGGFEPPKPIQPSMRPVARRAPHPESAQATSGSLFEPAEESREPEQQDTAPGGSDLFGSGGQDTPGAAAAGQPPAQAGQDSSSSSGPFGPGSAMPLPGGGQPSPDYPVKASVTALRYCTEDSPQYPRMVAEVWFASAADAERVGFRALS